MKLFLTLFFIFFTSVLAKTKEYEIFPQSEEYNTLYVHHGFVDTFGTDSLLFVKKKLVDGFLLELGALSNGDSSCVLYNDSVDIIIKKKNNAYYIGNEIACDSVYGEKKISLYFVNQRLKFFVDELLKIERKLEYDVHRKVGIRLKKNFSYSFFNCYYPVPMNSVDYGKLFDQENIDFNSIKIRKQNVGKVYSISFPHAPTKESERSIRFEYRYEDSKEMNKGRTQRGRSELSGVRAKSPMNKWIIEFDFFIPKEIQADSLYREVITQIHESSLISGVSPGFSIGIKGDNLIAKVQGMAGVLSKNSVENKKEMKRVYSDLGQISKNEWHHIKIYLREAYAVEMMPKTVIWLDGVEKISLDEPNCYSYTPRNSAYSYLKFGIYKWDWLNKEPVSGTERRVYYFDNYMVKY